MLWMLFNAKSSPSGFAALISLSITYLVTMIIFWRLMKIGTRDLKRAYLALILFDTFFSTMLIIYNGGYQSNFYLLYYPVVMFAAYLLTIGSTLSFVGLISIAYALIIMEDLTFKDSLDVAIRIGLLWFLSMAITFVSQHVRRSENRLLKLLDTLNMRTSELEKSQAHLEMIYDNSRILGGMLDVEGVIEGVMKITGELLSYPASGILLLGPGESLIYRGRNIGGRGNYHLKAVNNKKSGLLIKVASQTKPVIVKDITDREDYEPLNKRAKSVIIIPLVIQKKPNGLLIAESPNVGGFSERDEKMLSVVARSAAMALENATLHKRTEELTITDELTGIFNYRYFTRTLKEEQRRASRYDLPLSMIMLDIDHFKSFNDTYGHEIGNIVLKGITNVVKKCIRDVDIFARYGGEEFVIILPQTPQVVVTKIGERIREQIECTVFGGTDDIPELKVTVSVGISSFPENGRGHDELLSIVDQALYRAKGAGRNKVCVI
ncbi:MAG: sensor domain-containing diguanylate cyclase [Candidatus Zixiibacteriota bacterium]